MSAHKNLLYISTQGTYNWLLVCTMWDPIELNFVLGVGVSSLIDIVMAHWSKLLPHGAVSCDGVLKVIGSQHFYLVNSTFVYF